MFNKLNTKHLLIIFGVLLAIVLIVLPNKDGKKSRSFKSELIEFDSSSVTSISIFPKSGGDLISMEKEDGKWLVIDKEGSYNADIYQVKSILGTLAALKAKRLAAKGKDRWKEFEVNDSLGTRVRILDGKKTLADIYIGKFSYQQAPQNVNSYGQRQQGTMTSFVRLSEDKDIYAVDGFLSMSFNRPASEFRDRKISAIDNTKISKISFEEPNSKFELIKQGSTWVLDGLIADSSLMANYISSISNLRGSVFLPENSKPLDKPSHTLTIETEDATQPLKLYGYYTDSVNMAILSSENLGSFFDGKNSDLFNTIFRTKESLINKSN